MINKPKFLADAMLGNIARKLRLLGFDCKYFAAINDDQLLLIAKNENRILITKDHRVANVCKKRNISAISPISTDEIYLLVEILKKINITKCKIDMTNIRCTICNGSIQPIEKEKIIDKIPIGVTQDIQQFWTCIYCNQIYWEGTHIRNLQKFTDEINEKL